MIWVVPFSIVVFFVCVASLALSKFRPMGGSFDEKWPPISDGEFLRRCSLGTDRITALRARKLISDQLGVPYDQVYPEQHFVADLGCD